MIIDPIVNISSGIIDKETAKEINEDIIVTGNNYAILLDGATGLGGPRLEQEMTNAEWFIKNCSEYMKNFLDKHPDYDLVNLVKECIIHVKEKTMKICNEKGYSLKTYEEPSSSVIIVREFNGITDILSLGDSFTMIQTTDKKFTVIRDYNLSKLDNTVLDNMKRIAKEKNISILDAKQEDEIKIMLRKNRVKKNSGLPDGYWILSLNENIVDYAQTLSIDSSKIEKIVCISDGFNFKVLGLNEKEFFEKCHPYNIISLAEKVREIEEDDLNCNKFPRFKKKDDCSGFIWLPNSKHEEQN